ncbi:MAG TPA: plastocyanin/azurin family copper-binding protein [Solirubrobacteraceae bacterium]|jgi:hypothetical protein
MAPFTRNRRAAAAFVTLATALSGCGGGDDSTGSSSEDAATPAPTPAETAAPASGGGGGVPVTEKEWAVGAPASGKAGKVTFTVKNAGQVPHELVVIKTDKKAGDLGSDQADVAGKVGEAEDISPGESKDLSVTLKPGHYALICNLPGHYKQADGTGMFADFDVR